MWKDSEWAKKRQKTAKGKAAVAVAIAAAAAIGEEAIKEEEGEIQNKKALDALFNEIV